MSLDHSASVWLPQVCLARHPHIVFSKDMNEEIVTNGQVRYGHKLEDFQKIRTLGLEMLMQELERLDEYICADTRIQSDTMH
jgi:hypothetical protein